MIVKEKRIALEQSILKLFTYREFIRLTLTVNDNRDKKIACRCQWVFYRLQSVCSQCASTVRIGHT